MSETGYIELTPEIRLDIQNHLIDRGLALLGMRRSGKSWTTGRVCELLLEKNQPIIVVDMMGEYHTLREQFPILIASLGDPDYADIKNVKEDSVEQLVHFVVDNHLSFVLDLKAGRMIERFTYLGAFLQALYRVEEEQKKAYVLVMDEGHRIFPERGVVRIKAVREAQQQVEAWGYEIGATGGHYGLGFIVAARRPAEISKMILTQTDLRLVHKVVDPTDRKYLDTWLERDEIKRVSLFERGEVVLLGLESPIFTKVGERRCSHGGATPTAKPVEIPDLATSLEELQVLLASRPEPEAPEADLSIMKELDEKISSLEELIRGREAELRETRAQLTSQRALSDEYKGQIQLLQEQMPDVDDQKRLTEEYEKTVKHLAGREEELEAEVEDLKNQLEDAADQLTTVEGLGDLLHDMKDVMIEVAGAFDIDLIPTDIQKIIDEAARYKELYEEAQGAIDEKEQLAEDTLTDVRVIDWIKGAKRQLDIILLGSGNNSKVLKKLAATDPSFMMLPEDFSEVGVASTTVGNYLNTFNSSGWAQKHERGKHGRTAFTNRIPLWVALNVKRIRIDAPDEAVKKITDELTNFVITR
ncbi:DUF87 domain-containing protein [Candidatus Bathyarchaeota archaeon]|nr:DUF87 domain-containing protein [Candidatus Bathyarchaeota archaeon]